MISIYTGSHKSSNLLDGTHQSFVQASAHSQSRRYSSTGFVYDISTIMIEEAVVYLLLRPSDVPSDYTSDMGLAFAVVDVKFSDQKLAQLG